MKDGSRENKTKIDTDPNRVSLMYRHGYENKRQ